MNTTTISKTILVNLENLSPVITHIWTKELKSFNKLTGNNFDNYIAIINFCEQQYPEYKEHIVYHLAKLKSSI